MYSKLSRETQSRGRRVRKKICETYSHLICYGQQQPKKSIHTVCHQHPRCSLTRIICLLSVFIVCDDGPRGFQQWQHGDVFVVAPFPALCSCLFYFFPAVHCCLPHSSSSSRRVVRRMYSVMASMSALVKTISNSRSPFSTGRETRAFFSFFFS